jgi:hypothetical protein
MRGVAKTLILLLMLAAVPLRGYAAIAAGLCDAHHGGLATAHATGHAHASGHDDHSQPGNTEPAGHASVCSLCASCSVGASLAPDVAYAVAFAPAGASAIPFYGFIASGRVPDTLDRPPLPL